MKTTSSIIAAIVLATTAQLASAAPDVATDANSPSQSIASPKKETRVDADDIYKFTGTYDLSNGKSLTLFSRLGELYAVVQGGKWHMLNYEGNNTFVSRDKTMKIHLDFQKDGQAEGGLYLADASTNLAQGNSQGEEIAIASRQ